MKKLLLLSVMLLGFEGFGGTIGFRLFNNSTTNIPAYTYSANWIRRGTSYGLGVQAATMYPGDSYTWTLNANIEPTWEITTELYRSSITVTSYYNTATDQNKIIDWYVQGQTVSNWFCARALVRNVDSVTHNYRAYANEVAIETRAVEPGGLWEFVYCNSVYTPVRIARLSSDGSEDQAAYYAQYGTNTSVINANTNIDFSAVGNQYQGGTTNILWGTNAPNVGDSALYDALTKFANQNHIDLTALLGKDEVFSNYVSVSTSNKIDIVVTNQAEITTNWLAELNRNLTNGATASNMVVTAYPSWGTNGQEALDKAAQILEDGGVKSSMDRLKEKLAAPEISGPEEPDLTMEFMGRTIDLNPAHQWPGLAAMVRAGFELMLWIWFINKMVHVFWENLKLLSNAKTGGVGSWQGAGVLGWGTGLFGMFTGIAIPAAFSAIFIFAVKWFLDHFFDKIAAGLNWGNWITLLGVGYALIDAWFPISTWVSLTCTAWVSSLSVGFVASTAMIAARHLLPVGK